MTFLTFGVLSIVAGFLTLLLPETLNEALPDTVLQASDIGQVDAEGKRKKSGLQLLRNHRASNDSIDEVGYGKSPEWVEVKSKQILKHYS